MFKHGSLTPVPDNIDGIEIGKPTIHTEGRNRLIDFQQHYDRLLFEFPMYKTCNKKAILAGGCIRDIAMFNNNRTGYPKGDEGIKDYDVFLLGADHKDMALRNSLSKNFSDSVVTHYGLEYVNSAGTLVLELKFPFTSKTVQVILSECETMEELLNSFDWNACRFGYDGREFSTDGVVDFFQRKLTINDNAKIFPMSSLRRGFYLQDKYRQTIFPINMTREGVLTLSTMLLWQQ